jgi:predicted dehydrogenase
LNPRQIKMSKAHRILVIGVGSIGERHLRCFQNSGRCEVAFCETMDERRADVAARYGVTGYDSLDQALAEASFEAAVIAAPAPFHIPIAHRLTELGVHLLLEKPVSTSLEGIDELVELIERKATRVSVGYMMRGLPALVEMKAVLDSGRFGKPVELLIAGGQNFPFYRPAYREIYYANRAMGGGAIQDCIPHHLNAGEWLVGPITRLVADAEHCVLEGVEVEDTVHVMTRHGAVLGSLTMNQHQAPNELQFTVLCERGAVRFEMSKQRWYSAQEPGGDWTMEAEHTVDRDGFYINQANAFLDQLEGKRDPLCSLEAGIQSLRVTLAIFTSVEQQRWVAMDGTGS